MFDRLDALGLWLWLTAAQTTFWLGLGLLASRRFADRPAPGHRLLVLAAAAALLSAGLGGVFQGLGWGLFIGPEPAAVFRVAGERPAGPAGPFDQILNPTWLLPRAVTLAWIVAGGGLLLRLARSIGAGQARFGRCPAVADPDLREAFDREAAALGLTPPPLVSSPAATNPLVWAFSGRPRVVLPASRLPRGPLWWAVARHELAHLKRGDAWTTLLAEALAAALFWHPLAWAVRRRLRLAAEFACDDYVLAGGDSGLEYAEALLGLAPVTPGDPQVGTPAVAPAATGDLATRIRRLLRPRRVTAPDLGRAWGRPALAVVLLLATGVALVQARPAPRPKDDGAWRARVISAPTRPAG